MPLMTKIRERMTTFFSVFAGLFVVYIVLDWGMDITGRRHASRLQEGQEMGKVNGTPISVRDFNDLVKQISENQKAQTGVEPDDNQLRLIRDQAWNQLVDDHLYGEEVTRLGIKVSDEEIRDWVFGDNPPDFLKRQFVDSAGTFDRIKYESALKDPRNKSIIVTVEQGLRKQREREKLQSVMLASVNVSEGELLQRFADRSVKYQGEYLLLDPTALLKDDEFKPTDDELRKYYNEHSGEFKVEATRRLKYVQFPYMPSGKDSEDIRLQVDDIVKRAKAGVDFLDLVKTYSETPAPETFTKHGELGQEKEKAIFGAAPGTLLEPTKEFDGYHIIKVLEFRDGTDEYIHASHILITAENGDSVAALKKAREIAAAAKRGENFADLAKKNSKDPSSAAQGGDLGWFGKGRMVKPFEDAAYAAKVGQIVGPVRSAFGWHIIKVLGRDKREVKFAEIKLPIQISTITKGDLDQKAQDFDVLAKEGDFLKEAAQSKLNPVETPPFQKTGSIPGIGPNPAVMRFAFSEKVGKVSDVITLPTGAAVFMVSEVKEAGIRPFDELKTMIEGRVLREKKMAKLTAMANELKQGLSPTDSLQQVAAKRPGLGVQPMPEFTLSGTIPGVGRDQALIGAISTLNVHEISRPIQGSRGVFLVRLNEKTPLDTTAYRAQKESLRKEVMTEKRNRYLSEWSEGLKKSADIVDNRDVFFH